MAGTRHLWLFIVSGLLLNITPGPDSLFIMARSATQGWRAGFVACWGIGSGTLVHVLAAAYGWPEDAILALPRSRRRRYASAIADRRWVA